MKRVLFVLMFIAVSLSVSAQKTVSIANPVSKTEVSPAISQLVKSTLISGITEYKEYQALERDAKTDPNEPVGNLKKADYVLITEVDDMFGDIMISAKLMDAKAGSVVKMAKQMTENQMPSIQKACTEIVKEMFGEQK